MLKMDINKPTEHACVSRYVLIPQNTMPKLDAIRTEILQGQKTAHWSSVVKVCRYPCICFTWIKAVSPCLSGTSYFPREKKIYIYRQETVTPLIRNTELPCQEAAMTYSFPEEKMWDELRHSLASRTEQFHVIYTEYRDENLSYSFCFPLNL